MFSFFKKNKKTEQPAYVESVDDYPHLKIVKLKGDLNGSAVSGIQHFLQEANSTGKFLNKSVLLDFKHVDHVDSAVVAGLVKVLSQLRQKNHKFGLMNVPDNLRGMLEIMRLENIFLVFESEGRAFSEILAWSEDWN